MVISLALRRLLRSRSQPAHAQLTVPTAAAGASGRNSVWQAIWQARLDRLAHYLKRLREARKAQSMGITRRRPLP